MTRGYRGGGLERQVRLEPAATLEVGDEFKHELEVYKVTSLQPGHGDYNAVLLADLIVDPPPLGADG
jgi:hypothetical protein